jgi:hypothetical protein
MRLKASTVRTAGGKSAPADKALADPLPALADALTAELADALTAELADALPALAADDGLSDKASADGAIAFGACPPPTACEGRGTSRSPVICTSSFTTHTISAGGGGGCLDYDGLTSDPARAIAVPYS